MPARPAIISGQRVFPRSVVYSEFLTFHVNQSVSCTGRVRRMRCPSCGREVEIDRLYCPSCGAILIDDSLGGLVNILGSQRDVSRSSPDPAIMSQRPSSWSAGVRRRSHTPGRSLGERFGSEGSSERPGLNFSDVSRGQEASAMWAAGVGERAAGNRVARDAQAPGLVRRRDLIVPGIAWAVVLLLIGTLLGSAYANGRIRSLSDEDLRYQYGMARLDVSATGDSPPKVTGESSSGGSSKGLGTSANMGASTQSTGDISPDWRDQEFVMDGHRLRLGTFTVGEFMDQTGWTVDGSVTPADAQFEPGQGPTSIALRNPAYNYEEVLVAISATNAGSSAAGMRDCVVTNLSVGVLPHDASDYPDFEIAGGISLRGTSAGQAKGLVHTEPTQDSVSAVSLSRYSLRRRVIVWKDDDMQRGLALSFDEDADGELYMIELAMKSSPVTPD